MLYELIKIIVLRISKAYSENSFNTDDKHKDKIYSFK